MNKSEIAESFKDLQDEICDSLEGIDGQCKFVQDLWKRESGGGGRTRIISQGAIIEKGGVNFSEVHGEVTDLMRNNTEITADQFFATGVSIVLHPENPNIPIIHMNVRYFELSDGKYWFGGGIDLTPHYIVDDQARAFHKGLKDVCDEYDAEFYPKFKKWADDYFFIPHRNETRGIGGIFFDHLNEHNSISKVNIHKFCIDLGRLFCDLYAFQVSQGKDLPYGEKQLEWRNVRRGRYVEFNLVNDRGTKFGLVSGGRTESILMSLPANASWFYQYEVLPESQEANTLKKLVKNKDWINA